MKKIKFYLSFLAVFALLLTSCSKDEDSGTSPDSDKATLSFGAIVQDLANKSTNKQSEIADMPVCVEDAPAYVEIVLMQGDAEIVGTLSDPFRVDLVAGQIFTKEVPELELEPGNYTLEHFSVYNAEGDLTWIAPKGGVLAEFVDSPLPLNISLGAGVKKYVDVSVLCFDDRDVNEYGYLFFELDTNEAFEYCFFANYCTPEGRHWPARFSVEISIDGEVLYSANENINNVGVNNDGDFYAEPICFALPNLDEYTDDEAYIDYVLVLQDWDGAYGDVDQMVLQGSLSRNDVTANFDGDNNVFYDHQRFGCDDNGGQPVDSDGDGVDDSMDQCPGTDSGVEVDATGCPVQEPDTDGDGVVDSVDQCPGTESGVEVDATGCPIQEPDTDGDGVVDSIDQCPGTESGVEVDEVGCPIPSSCVIDDLDNTETCARGITPPSTSPDYAEVGNFFEVTGNTAIPILEDTGSTFGPSIGTVGVEISGSSLSLTLDPVSNLYFTDYKIEVSDSSGGAITCITGVDLAEVNNGDAVDYTLNVEGSFSYPIYLKVVSNECPVTN